MSGCAVSHIPFRSNRQLSVTRNHREMTQRARRIVGMLCVILALTIAGSLPALGQETSSGELERIDVEPPERRAAPRRAEPAYDLSVPEDEMPWDTPSTPGESGLGSDSPMPPLSVVTDKTEISMSPAALPSEVYVVTKEEIERLDVRNVADLFRKVPGMKAFNYGLGDVGDSFEMRGYTAAHGKDVGVFIDDVPQNFPSAAQGGNGMSDISWLTPEMIERIDVIKGPFSALYGNFAQAGIINITTRNSDPSPNLTVSGGSFGNIRGVGVVSFDFWHPTPFLVNEYQSIDGYRDNSQYKRFSTFNKGTTRIWDGLLSLRFNYYHSNWGEAGCLDLDEVKKGIVDRRSAADCSAGGDQRRWAFVVNYSPVEKQSGLYLSAYVGNYEKNRFLTWLPYPQSMVADDRAFSGGRIFYNFVFGNFASLAVGGQTRYDSGSAQKGSSVRRQVTAISQDYGLGLLNTAWFVQLQVKPADSLKFVGGVRGDYFQSRVDNRLIPLNSGKAWPSIISPRLGLVITPMKNLNLFGNKGLGFRSPAAEEMSPSSSSGTKNFQLAVAKTDSWDMGFNLTLFENLFLTADYYRTDMEREVRTIAEEAVNIGNSERNGYEAEARFYASKEISLFANYAWVDAKVKNPTIPGQDKVPYVSEDVIKAGIEFTFDLTPDMQLLGDIYYEYMSGWPFYMGSSTKPYYAPDFDMYNFKFAWQGRNWGLFCAALYQPRQYSSDGVYPNASGTGLVFVPRPVWDLNAGVKYTF